MNNTENNFQLPCDRKRDKHPDSDGYVTIENCKVCGLRNSCDTYITFLAEQKEYESE